MSVVVYHANINNKMPTIFGILTFIYEHDKFHAQLNRACKKFTGPDLGPSCLQSSYPGWGGGYADIFIHT